MTHCDRLLAFFGNEDKTDMDLVLSIGYPLEQLAMVYALIITPEPLPVTPQALI
jgi:hypothetical protein